MLNDRDKLQRILEARADGDFGAMSDVELRAYAEDLGRELAAKSRPAVAYDPRDPEHVARSQVGAELFKRLIHALKECDRREARKLIHPAR
jgi:crotonobetainyl-CoA:carnitine CoA-transferase CaiB-like acyl-CoA transferase